MTMYTVVYLTNNSWRACDLPGDYTLEMKANTLPPDTENTEAVIISEKYNESLSYNLHYLPPTKRAELLIYVDVYMDDFIDLYQGDPKKIIQVTPNLFTTIYHIFLPHDEEETHQQDPNSIKKCATGKPIGVPPKRSLVGFLIQYSSLWNFPWIGMTRSSMYNWTYPGHSTNTLSSSEFGPSDAYAASSPHLRGWRERFHG